MKFSLGYLMFFAMVSISMVFALERTSVADEPRLWTSADNMFKLNATLIGVTSTEVKLKRADNGNEVSVPIAKLSEADRTFLALRPTNQTSQPRQNQPNAKQTSNSSIPKLTLQPIDESSYKLEPLGILMIPAPGFKWEPASGRSMQAFQATKEGNPNTLTLTIHPSAISNQDRKSFIEKDWEELKKTLVAGGGTFRNQVLPTNKERFEQVEWVSVESENKGQQVRNLVAFGFAAGVTLRIHHTGPDARMGGSMATDVLRKFNTILDPKNESVELPTSVAREVSERITLLKSLIAKKDFRSIVFEFTSAEDFQQLSGQSELRINQAVESYVKTNGALLKRAVSNLQTNEARYNPKADAVFFPKMKPLAMAFARKNGRWTLPYPKVFSDASAADVMAAEKSEPVPSTPEVQAGPGKELAISKIDDQWVMFSPFGKVPIPEQAFEWKLVAENPPAIETTKVLRVEGNPNPLGSEILRVEIYSSTSADERKTFVSKLELQLKDKLKSDNPRVKLIESSLDGLDLTQVPVSFEFQLEGRATSVIACSYVSCIFMTDKTVVVHATASGTDKTLRRATNLAQAVLAGIKRDSNWYPPSSLDPQIKQQVSMLIAEMQGMLEAGEFEKLFMLVVPPEQLTKIKSSPGGLEKAVKQFKEEKSIKLTEGLKAIDWKTASFVESEKMLTFGSSEVRFALVDGKWRLR